MPSRAGRKGTMQHCVYFGSWTPASCLVIVTAHSEAIDRALQLGTDKRVGARPFIWVTGQKVNRWVGEAEKQPIQKETVG